jgi:serralysin
MPGSAQRNVILTTDTWFTLPSDADDLIYSGITTFFGFGNDKDNLIIGGEYRNSLYGYGGNDTLKGGAGNDTLNGGSGNNLLIGKLGNDDYFIESDGDKISEAPESGLDAIYTNLNQISIPNNVEYLTFTSAEKHTGIGNSLDNYINGATLSDDLYGGDGADWLVGQGGDDRLFGQEGADQLVGEDGNDWLNGGSGNDGLTGGNGNDTYIVDRLGDQVIEDTHAGRDTVFTSLSSYTLGESVENLTYTGRRNFKGTGNTLANVITGNRGNDTLDGGVGADTLIGADGNDTYIVDSLREVVSETANAGNDTVRTSTAHYTLGANVENLVHTGHSAFLGSGNSLDNSITGGVGNDTLKGGIGNDRLAGRGGADIISGGSGPDTFVYTTIADSTSKRQDTILDFSPTAGDVLDISSIDANSTRGTRNDTFVYVGGSAFSGTAGELRFAGGRLQADIDGDRVADLTVKFDGTKALSVESLIL